MIHKTSIPSIKVRVAHPRRPTPMTTFPAALDDGRVPYETQRGAHWCDGHTKVRYRIRNLGKVPAQGVTRRRRISGSPTRRWCCVDKILPCIYLFAFPLLFEEEDLSPDCLASTMVSTLCTPDNPPPAPPPPVAFVGGPGRRINEEGEQGEEKRWSDFRPSVPTEEGWLTVPTGSYLSMLMGVAVRGLAIV